MVGFPNNYGFSSFPTKKCRFWGVLGYYHFWKHPYKWYISGIANWVIVYHRSHLMEPETTIDLTLVSLFYIHPRKMNGWNLKSP